MVARLRRSERGIALLIVLITIALMTLLVVDFTTAAALGYRSAAEQADELRAQYLARSAVQVGLALLSQSAQIDAMSKQPYDGLNQPWAMPFPPIPLNGGMVGMSIVDEARKLDINELVNQRNGQVNATYAAIMARLFGILGVSPDILPAIIDWLDRDSIQSPGGAEADYYLDLMPPYEPRNGPMPTIGDLRMVRGVNDATFALLSRFLTVAPETRVNANTAPPEVLAALTPELAENPSLVKQIIEARTVAPFLAVTDVANLPGIGSFANHLTPLLTTRSSYFTITGMGSYAGTRARVIATFRRNLNGTEMLANWHED
jgi:general secretion pathway protein K